MPGMSLQKIPVLQSNTILRTITFLSILLVIFIFFMYRYDSWPHGTEALGCVTAIIILSSTTAFLWFSRNQISDDIQKRNVRTGLYIGLLWTIEIGINNIIRPGLPLRDYIDNSFWGLIAILILFSACIESYRTKSFLNGLRAGFWSGFASGVVSCLTALFLIVFGMKLILLDPLNIKEWADIKTTENTTVMAVYFAYQTLAGALMHLILGMIMGVLLGSIAGLTGWIFGSKLLGKRRG